MTDKKLFDDSKWQRGTILVLSDITFPGNTHKHFARLVRQTKAGNWQCSLLKQMRVELTNTPSESSHRCELAIPVETDGSGLHILRQVRGGKWTCRLRKVQKYVVAEDWKEGYSYVDALYR